MKTNPMNSVERPGGRGARSVVAPLIVALGLCAGAVPVHAQQPGGVSQQPVVPLWEWDRSDPRIGLRGGVADAAQAARHMELIANTPRPEGFATNSDLAFRGNLVFQGNYNGFNIYDITDPAKPQLRVSILCPGNQGDISVMGNLLFHSVQATDGRLDCGSQGVEAPASPERFRGVRIFDLTDIDTPRQVAAVQTCRGSHTHTLVTRPGDDANVYVYVSGTSGVRPAEELPGCLNAAPEEDANTSRFQIEVIQVPLAAPQNARIVSEPRVFADARTGEIAGLRSLTREGTEGGATAACHDITSYPAIGLAGGACSGNGLLLDIRDPVNPIRLDEVADANFAYWHSATFNNDGTKVIFTDEWGGGSAPRCRDIDPPAWGANAIFDLVGGKLRFGSYYKLPVPQTETENCVAHNGSLIPVPGRDIKVQSWYQGGISVFDFTDSQNPVEIAFFDRGPNDEERLMGGGQWSAYWYNGYIYGSEMVRGLDVLRLTPSEHLSQNEIDAALLVHFDEFNPQHQPQFSWPVSYVVARAHVDQLERARAMPADAVTRVRNALQQAEQQSGGARNAAVAQLVEAATALEAEALAALSSGRADNDSQKKALLATSLRQLAAQGR